MKVIEQLKDDYGNLLLKWGIYELISKTDNSTTYPKKIVKKVLVSTHPSLKEAEDKLEELEK